MFPDGLWLEARVPLVELSPAVRSQDISYGRHSVKGVGLPARVRTKGRRYNRNESQVGEMTAIRSLP
jgi:hypothetical protein